MRPRHVAAVAIFLGVAIVPSGGVATAAAMDGCEALTLSSPSTSSVVATVPASLGYAVIAPGAFRLQRHGGESTLTATPLPASDLVVVVSVLASPTTSEESFNEAVAAAVDLVRGLPPGSRSEVVLPDRSAPVVPTSDRAASLESLRALTYPGGSGSELPVNQAQLASNSREYVMVFTDRSDQLPEPPGVSVTRLEYGPSSGTRLPSTASDLGCPSPASHFSLLARADDVVARLFGQYELHLPQNATDSPAQIRLTQGQVDARAVLDSVSVPPRTTDPLHAAPGESSRPGTSMLVGVVLVVVLGFAVSLLLARRSRSRRGPLHAQGGEVTPVVESEPQPVRQERLARSGAGSQRIPLTSKPAAASRSSKQPGWTRIKVGAFMVVLLLAGVVGAVIIEIPPVYTGSASVILTAPRVPIAAATSPARDANQLTAEFLSYAPSLGVTAQVVARSLVEHRAQLLRNGMRADYDIQFGDQQTAIQYVAPDLHRIPPMVRISARSGQAAATREALEVLIRLVQVDLSSRQQAAGAPSMSYIRASVLAPPIVLRTVPGSRSRALAGVLLLTMLAMGCVYRTRVGTRITRPDQPASG